MQTLTVELERLTYPIYIGENLLNKAELLQQHIHGKQVLIVSTQRIADLYLKRLSSHLTDYQVDIILLPDGEQHKTLSNVEKIITMLITNHHHRNTTLIALGGGVIGDITGFAAACYQRGVNYIQIPTTLLAQVDSSIGGKTAVNHELGKNMIGAFHQPQCVITDTVTLNSLDQRQYNSGIAEIIKAALICDADFFTLLEANMPLLLKKDPPVLTEAIFKACTIKRNIVMQDEKDINGTRALLNLGHTFGHALEQITNYKTYLHGEAVAIGITLAAVFSIQQQKLLLSDLNRIKQLFQAAKLPTMLPNDIDNESLLKTILNDKKTYDTNVTLVLLKKIGVAKLIPNISLTSIAKALRTLS